jgi:hypothetical protein
MKIEKAILSHWHNNDISFFSKCHILYSADGCKVYNCPFCQLNLPYRTANTFMSHVDAKHSDINNIRYKEKRERLLAILFPLNIADTNKPNSNCDSGHQVCSSGCIYHFNPIYISWVLCWPFHCRISLCNECHSHCQISLRESQDFDTLFIIANIGTKISSNIIMMDIKFVNNCIISHKLSK